MKWDEIHDQSRVVVDKAIENLLAEGKEVEKKEDNIVGKLRDAEYVGKKLEKRKRYSGKDAFLRLKRKGENVCEWQCGWQVQRVWLLFV